MEKEGWYYNTICKRRHLRRKTTCLGSGEQLSLRLRSASAKWLRSSSSCRLHLMFCSLSVWFCCSSSRSLLVTHSLILAALASTWRASCSRSWRCSSTSPSSRLIWALFASLAADHASFCSIIRTWIEEENKVKNVVNHRVSRSNELGK